MKDSKEMRNHVRQTGRRGLSLLLVLCLLISALSGIVLVGPEKKAKAADDDIAIMIAGGAKLSSTEANKMKDEFWSLELYSKSLVFKPEDFRVEWAVESGTTTVLELRDGSNIFHKNLYAKMVGKDTISVTVYDKRSGGETYVGKVSCQINVEFGIDTWEGGSTYFQELDGKRILGLKLNDSHQLKIGLGGTAKWETDDPNVATVDPDSGMVTSVGAGTANITAKGSGTGSSDTIPVYVAPGVGLSAGSISSYANGIVTDYIYTNAVFADKEKRKVFDKRIYWEVLGSESTEPIITSLNPRSEKVWITSGPDGIYDNRLEVGGVAGNYTMKLYTIGTRNAVEEGKLKNMSATLDFTIQSKIGDKNISLGINDKYNLYEAFNMSKADFNYYFDPPVLYLDKGETRWEDFSETNVNSIASLSNLEVTGKKHGNVAVVIHVKDNPTVRAKLQLLLNGEVPPDYYGARFVITDKITLSSDSQEMMKETSQILSVKGFDSKYTITWASSDPAKVSVVGNGKTAEITAKELVGEPGVTISATMYVGDGVYRVATTQITVIDRLTDFELDHPEDETLTLFVDQQEPVRVKVKEDEDTGTAELPLLWTQSSGDEIIDIETQDGNRWAWITGKKGGKTTLMVTNILDGKVRRVNIEVVIAVKKLKFTEKSYTFAKYTGGRLMAPLLEMDPKDATASEIVWSSSDDQIAAINDTGYLNFVNPGTVTVTADIKNNYKGIPPATCQVTITGTPDEIIFENLKDGHLTVEAGKTATVNFRFVPETAQTSLSPSASKKDIIQMEVNVQKKQIYVLGKNPGEVTATFKTDDNVYYSFTVTVTKGAKSVTFKDKDKGITLYRGDPQKEKADLSKLVQVEPKDTTDTLTYGLLDQSNDKYVEVDKKTGIITAKEATPAGGIYATATTSSNYTGAIKVIVVDQVTGIEQDAKSKKVKVGETITIKPKIIPETAGNKTLKWDWEPSEEGEDAAISLKEKGSEVDVTGESVGTVLLTCVSEDNTKVKAVYIIKVVDKDPSGKTDYNTKVKLSPDTKYLDVGKKFTVTRKVTGAYKGNKSLAWRSSNKKVASVNKNGKVKAKKVGKATITAIALDGSRATGKMKVVVQHVLKGIKMNKSSATIMIDGTVQLSVSYKPANATVKGVKWSTGNSAIATVNGGKVLGISKGIVKITATSKDPSHKKCYCWVTVTEPMPITDFTIENDKLTIQKGKDVHSGITPNPVNSTDSITWWSDNPAVASVDQHGKIRTHSPGQATIYARASNGVEGHVDVNVVDLNRKAVTLRQYDQEQLSVILISENVVWYSADPLIAKVDENGLVTAQMPGTTIIYANVEGVKLGCRVTVTKITG